MEQDKVTAVLEAFSKSAIRNIGTAELEILIRTLTTANDLRPADDAGKEARRSVLATLNTFKDLRMNIEAAERSKVLIVLESINDLRMNNGTTIQTPEQILDRIDGMFKLARDVFGNGTEPDGSGS